MTRVNCGVDPWELPRQALLAEHREITRIPNEVRRRPNLSTLPPSAKFRFGEGHVTFFRNKLAYLHNRYWSIYQECRKRGYNVTCKSDAFLNLPATLMKDYTPTFEDRELTLTRLKERGHILVGQKKKPRKVKLKRIKV